MSNARTKAEVAVAETDDAPATKTIDFRGLALTAPPQLPAGLLFDLADLEDEASSLKGLIGVLRSIFGGDQLQQIRAKLDADELDFAAGVAALSELIDSTTGAYGMEPGEAEASAAS